MIETKFKDTEVGRIPVDWDLEKLKDCFEFKSNNTFSRDALSESGEIQNVHYGDVLINYGSHLDAQKDPIPYVARPNFKVQDCISDGDVIVADTAEDETVGKATEVINVGNKQIVSGLHTMWLHPIVEQRYALGYLGYAFNASIYHNQLLPLMQGTKVTSISKSAIKDTYILVPPIAEQHRIAKALSDIDSLIMQLDKLIEKKRAIKQGAMQQLLTGKVRLKGFTEPWVEKKLGKIGSLAMCKRIFQEETSESGDVPFYKIGTFGQQADAYISKDKYEQFKSMYRFPNKGDVLISAAGTIGRTVVYDGSPAYFQDSNIVWLVHNENQILNSFLFYVYQRIEWNTENTTIARLYNNNFNNTVVVFPKSLREQSIIVSVLSSMDDEISALESRRDKYTAIKQGMMQKLLTGKIRLLETIAKPNKISANVHFRRSVLAAEIADRLCEEPTFGHVKMEKILFLSERMCRIDIGSHYHRDAAGPYDNRALHSIDSQLKKQKWFEVKHTDKGNRYVPMQNRGKHSIYFTRYYADVLPMFEKIIATFKTWNTERCEIVATLYSAWEDMLHTNKPFTDADIVSEVLNNWHESKKRISQERWHNALQWMRDNGFTPENTKP